MRGQHLAGHAHIRSTHFIFLYPSSFKKPAHKGRLHSWISSLCYKSNFQTPRRGFMPKHQGCCCGGPLSPPVETGALLATAPEGHAFPAPAGSRPGRSSWDTGSALWSPLTEASGLQCLPWKNADPPLLPGLLSPAPLDEAWHPPATERSREESPP